GTVSDVDEHPYFLGMDDPRPQQENTGILQCYPNPCTDHATVRFNLAGSSQVTLELFNIQGSRVATLIHQDLNTGIYEIDLNTSLLQPGTYICRLLLGNIVHSLKLIVSR
ncbi:MAG: T9SS type A sorting domain-containing protein, partial [Bacteroidota bacterium]